MKSYPCMVPGCANMSAWYARGNVPKYGHVCAGCFQLVPLEEREHYAPAAEALGAAFDPEVQEPELESGTLEGEPGIVIRSQETTGFESFDEQVRSLIAESKRDELNDLYGKVGNARPLDEPHCCHARGCRVPVKPEYLMCIKHWRQVPRPIQNAVWAAYRPGQCDDKNPSPSWHIAADAAIGAVAQREGWSISPSEERAVDAFKSKL